MNKKELETAISGGSAPVWILTDGKAGDEAQCIGVAEALGLAYERRVVRPRAPFTWAMPYGPIDPRESELRPGSPLAPPFPRLAIASGRRAVPYLKRLKRISDGYTFTVFLKDPRTGPATADFIWVSTHDRLRGDNVMVTLTAPHRMSAARLARASATPDPRLDGIAHPRVAVLVGGDSRHHRFSDADVHALVSGLETWARIGARLMITTSRRTPPALARALVDLSARGGHFFWDGTGDNPLAAMLARAEAIVVTADSTNMIGEAAATGRAVHVFHPGGGHAKIGKFLSELAKNGILHPFPGPLKTTTYEPLNSTPEIAAAIRDALLRRAAAGQSTIASQP
ncbi:nucleoside-diphosphate sugar epimerase [Microvirga tunisiensis]|uniref:Nucleoside-diphosphate sugar epimerase n=2 Tax=Pannonibacter tanglangensis TaxID=2750084 RepID=A0A7X5EZN0_9HYPH|nr:MULTISPECIES: mitochondrial fission ELM1 family protein [unclassified Pannonibacter]NBN63436.1 nucleoside-diphosphate sugar epimerase [Pannonibacter sp. XCT-34]NBN77073.1 nucleoside-diphosphate sugar epimerase [Pannonibacter sp. XCT-53]